MAGESLFEMASEGKLGFEELSGALKKATSEGGKFYKNTAREAKILADAQLQTSKMSEKLFLELGQALEPLMIGFEKIKQGLLLGIVTPIKNIISSVMDLFGRLKELVSYVGGKFVEGFKVAFDPIVKLFEKVANLASNIWDKVSKILGLSKEDPLKAPFDGKRSVEERLKNQDKIDKDNFNKQMISDYSDLQNQIFKMQREVALKPF
ncbi:hypothetical protein [Borrelia venezuelensis]|uniref:hypothetical protein n=1 Tax=Borrelia venezuelensis TaxID=1653839 RepID=UPI001FF49FB2|nr:hypothetical protein [Borrelia venezuelensis]UPA12716.1 hypothetical protein bvRMA01_001052 [Borrelia venezuelensis]